MFYRLILPLYRLKAFQHFKNENSFSHKSLMFISQTPVFNIRGSIPQNNERFDRRFVETDWTALKDKSRFGTQFLYNAAPASTA